MCRVFNISITLSLLISNLVIRISVLEANATGSNACPTFRQIIIINKIINKSYKGKPCAKPCPCGEQVYIISTSDVLVLC